MSKLNYPIKPLPLDKVQITDDFWTPRIDTSLRVTIPHALKNCEKTNRIANFSKAAGLIELDVISAFPFDDSDVFKIKTDPESAKSIIKEAMKLLSGPIPESNPDCEYCNLVEARED